MRSRLPATALLALAACSSEAKWTAVQQGLPAALLSVWGTSATDIWAAGADTNDGKGPLVQHFDGTEWKRLETGQTAGDLWWAFGFAGGPVYFGGSGGMILRHQDGAFTRMPTPSGDTIFGIWGASPDDLWAVGGALGGASGAFAWRSRNGGAWAPAEGFPAQLAQTDAMWKMYGRAANDAWIVGTNGKVVRWDGTTFTPSSTGTAESLFTVHASAQRFVAVGGFGTGNILENDGSGWKNVSPAGASSVVGVCLGEDVAYAAGAFGEIHTRTEDGWKLEDTGLTVNGSLHSVWIDPDGGVWAVGGRTSNVPLIDGVMLHKGN